ncbi:hypothetical protein CHY_2501 [Carboxydothermus hydrogenoformans Z-2901]|uniref:Uncharacterized protein n=1 Tax=Carboxydothermus hydrogenoformans (strain ATCC BAA-161 / DSM 6008 / Z-2901) TaxID=246194 RepID=Q3A989_CARHZ|nr:hypothetical protein CHY_2501 [Carboxydothermus hydrogenoformans Z-2901]
MICQLEKLQWPYIRIMFLGPEVCLPALGLSFYTLLKFSSSINFVVKLKK